MIPNSETDDILAEIHATRRAISEKFNGDFSAMLADARQRQAASGRPIWKPKGLQKVEQFLAGSPVPERERQER